MGISSPEMKSVGDVYQFHWVPEGIHMRVDHIAEGESITGEFNVALNGQNNAIKHLYQVRINMLSATGKKSLCEALNKRHPLQWDEIVEQACFGVIRAYREGDPVLAVGDMPKRDKAKYRLYPWIIEDGMTSMYGYGGSGKSYVAGMIVVMVQTGYQLLGFRPIQGNCLILDWESCQEDWDERTKAISNGFGIKPPLILYKRCYRPLANDIPEIQKIVLSEDVKMIVIDSVGMASELTSEYHASAIQMLRATRSLGISALLIDHKTKTNELFGSVYKLNEVRTAFEIKSTAEAGGNTMDISIKHTKINNGPLTKPIGLHVEFSGTEDTTEKAIFSKVEVADIPELAKDEPAWIQIRNELRRGPMTVEALSEDLGIEEAAIRVNLNRHKEVFVKTLDGWGIVDNIH
jgi:hypothetical protein